MTANDSADWVMGVLELLDGFMRYMTNLMTMVSIENGDGVSL